MSSATNVCAVIVTYNPTELLKGNLAVLRPQVGGVVLVDNASREETQPLLELLATENGVWLIRNPENYGIARALNQGIVAAQQRGFEWVVLFDQDSTVEPDYVEKMLRTYATATTPNSVAVVVPAYIDRKTGKRIPTGAHNGELLCAMTSGSLIRGETFQTVGYHEEELFIDYVDTEWCQRARSMGMKIAQSDAALLHSLGRLTYHKFLGHEVYVTNHSVGRIYYRERNRWHIYLRRHYEWQWFRRDVYLAITGMVAIMLWEEQRWRKLKAIIRGVTDGLSNRMGKNTEMAT